MLTHPVVILLCGLPGSGKTTYSGQLRASGYARLSIDEEIWSGAGRYGIDYPEHDYERVSAEADVRLRAALNELLSEHRSVVVDYGFLSRRIRDEYKALVTTSGAGWILIYLRAEFELLCARLERRGGRIDANAAFDIGPDRLAEYVRRFEAPDGEGEIIVDQTREDSVTLPDEELLRQARCR